MPFPPEPGFASAFLGLWELEEVKTPFNQDIRTVLEFRPDGTYTFHHPASRHDGSVARGEIGSYILQYNAEWARIVAPLQQWLAGMAGAVVGGGSGHWGDAYRESMCARSGPGTGPGWWNQATSTCHR